MIKEALSKEDSIVAIFDENGNLEYSSVDIEKFKYLIEDREQVKKELMNDRIVLLKDYIVKLEVLDLDFKKYFIANLYFISSEDSSLLSLAYIDNGTGLYNENIWNKIEESTMSPMKSDEYAMIVIDIDNFTNINDVQGFSEGNNIIKNISTIINDLMGISDISIRYDGDEFIIILPNSDRHRALYLLNRIRDEINTPYDIHIKISGGIAFSQGEINFRDMFIKARKNMNLEKNLKKKEILANSIEYNRVEKHLLEVLNIAENRIKDENTKKDIKKEVDSILSFIYKKYINEKKDRSC